MSKYKILLFDADGTILDFEKSEALALKKTFEKFNLLYDGYTHLNFYKKLNAEIWSEFENGEISAKRLKPERFRRFNSKYNFNIEPSLMSDTYLEYLSEAGYFLDGAEKLLTKLKEKFKMILLTNGLTAVQNRRFSITNMKKYFEKIIISEEVGFKKPQKEIFELSLKDIEYNNKNEILMIGDNLSSDILGGINFGIDTCWFNPLEKVGDENIKPTYHIQTFDELLLLVN